MPIIFDNMPSALPHINGRLIPIVVAAGADSCPTCPPSREVGLEPVKPDGPYYGIYGPKGLSGEVVDKVHAAVKKTVELTDVKKRIEDTGSLIVANARPSSRADQRPSSRCTRRSSRRRSCSWTEPPGAAWVPCRPSALGQRPDPRAHRRPIVLADDSLPAAPRRHRPFCRRVVDRGRPVASDAGGLPTRPAVVCRVAASPLPGGLDSSRDADLLGYMAARHGHRCSTTSNRRPAPSSSAISAGPCAST